MRARSCKWYDLTTYHNGYCGNRIYFYCNSASFEGFNATILAYGQTGSGKTYTMGSSIDPRTTVETEGIIPRVIKQMFETVEVNEKENPCRSFKISVQFLEIYGDDIRDLLDPTKTSRVAIRSSPTGEIYVSGAREEIVSSAQQMFKVLEDGTKFRTTAATCMNQASSRSHGMTCLFQIV